MRTIGAALLIGWLGPLQAQLDTSFHLPEPISEEVSDTMSLWATQYYVHRMASGGELPFRDSLGRDLGFYGDTCDFCSACLEGTAFIEDSLGNVVVLNYAGVAEEPLVNCRRCSRYASSTLNVESWGRVLWRETDGFGDGVLNYRLIPFRTVAVDPEHIPYGSVLYVPAARGLEVELADGTVRTHDGYFFAGDTGGAIRVNHIDVFTGVFEGNPFPQVIYSNPDYQFSAYLISDAAIVQAFEELHER